MVKLRGKTSIGEGINTIIGCLAEANDLKVISIDSEFEDEREALSRAQTLTDRAAATGRTVKEARRS